MSNSGASRRRQLSFFQRLQLREDPPPWSLVTAMVFVIAYPVLWIAGQAIAVTISGEQFDNPLPGVQIIGASIGAVAVIIGLIQWMRRRQGTLWSDVLKLGQSSSVPLFIAIVVGLGAAGVIDLARIFFKVDPLEALPQILRPLAGSVDTVWLWAAILALVVGPVTEGLVFYGVLYPALARDVKDNIVAVVVVALVYTVIVFMLSATPQPHTWSLLVQPFLMTLAIGGLRAYTQSTRLAIVARVMFGLFFILSGLITARS